MQQLSELLGVPLDPQAQAAVDSLTQHLEQYPWFAGVQCNPIDKHLNVAVSMRKCKPDMMAWTKLLPQQWNGFKVFGSGSGG